MIRPSCLAKWVSPALAFGVTVACISPFPDGALSPRWALLSLSPIILWISQKSIKLPTLIILFFLAVSLIWSPDRWHGADLLWHFIVLACIVSCETDDLRPIFWAIGLGLVINSLVVMAQIEGYDPVTVVNGAAAPGLFFNRNQQNSFVALAVIGLLSLRDWRAFALAIFASLPLVALPLERAPLIGLAAAAGFLVCRRWKWAIPAAIVLLGAAVVYLAKDPASFRVAAIGMRLETWFDAATSLTFWGHGLGSFRWTFHVMEYAHNDPLNIAYELGVPGILVAIALAWYALRDGPVAPRALLVCFMVEGLFDFPLYQPAASFLAAVVFGHLVHCRSRLRGPIARRQWLDHVREVASRRAGHRISGLQDGGTAVPAARVIP